MRGECTAEMKHLTTTIAALAIGGFCVATASPAQAQYVSPYTNPYTGRIFNNPNSSFFDTVITNNHNMRMLNNRMNPALIASMGNTRALRMRAGATRIKKGLASTSIPSTSFQTNAWVARCGGKTPEQKSQILAELVAQKDIWNQEMRARGAKSDDLAQALGVSFVLAWEAYSGQRATEQQFRWIVNDFRRFLLKDAFYQGMSATEKQYLAEANMLNSTDTVRQYRAGLKQSDAALQKSGQAAAGKFLETWWDSSASNIIATPTGFANRSEVKK